MDVDEESSAHPWAEVKVDLDDTASPPPPHEEVTTDVDSLFQWAELDRLWPREGPLAQLLETLDDAASSQEAHVDLGLGVLEAGNTPVNRIINQILHEREGKSTVPSDKVDPRHFLPRCPLTMTEVQQIPAGELLRIQGIFPTVHFTYNRQTNVGHAPRTNGGQLGPVTLLIKQLPSVRPDPTVIPPVIQPVNEKDNMNRKPSIPLGIQDGNGLQLVQTGSGADHIPHYRVFQAIHHVNVPEEGQGGAGPRVREFVDILNEDRRKEDPQMNRALRCSSSIPAQLMKKERQQLLELLRGGDERRGETTEHLIRMLAGRIYGRRVRYLKKVTLLHAQKGTLAPEADCYCVTPAELGHHSAVCYQIRGVQAQMVHPYT